MDCGLCSLTIEQGEKTRYTILGTFHKTCYDICLADAGNTAEARRRIANMKWARTPVKRRVRATRTGVRSR